MSPKDTDSFIVSDLYKQILFFMVS